MPSESDGAAAGLIDTNVFIHAQASDARSEECLRFLEAVERGEIRARLDPLVAHELTYALPHYRQGMTRADVAMFLLAVLAWDGIVGDRDCVVDAVLRWRDSTRLAFVDAYLAAVAHANGCPVYTNNVRDLASHGVVTPDPLLAGTPK
jgi:predicted nucleic acid-binding protein